MEGGGGQRWGTFKSSKIYTSMHTKAKPCCRVQKERGRKTLLNGEKERNSFNKYVTFVQIHTNKKNKPTVSDGGKAEAVQRGI